MTASQITPADQGQARPAAASLEAALAYQQHGWSVLPLKGKRPALKEWKQHQSQAASAEQIEAWHRAGLLENVGIVCGSVSNKLAVLDFDGPGAYAAFTALFPALATSFTVRTGSGQGWHLYLQVEDLPPTTRALDTPIGHIELRAEGTYVAAPPSIHPVTGRLYEAEGEREVLRVPDLKDVVAWIESFRKAEAREWQPPKSPPPVNGGINPALVSAIAEQLRAGRHRERGEWINCACPYPERHSRGDRNPSFGFNLASGYGYCYRCGTILAKELCERLGIEPREHGGLLTKPETPQILHRPKREERLTAPPPPFNLPSLAELELPDWLKQYTGWASQVGNQTPLIFHQAAGIWLLSVAVARRLYVEAPWGIRLFPNLYMMFVADTTFYRKTTAYKLAESVIRGAIPHMLMPTPGSPERFQDALAGRPPGNYKELTYEQQELLNRARAFAAQRGLFKDEVAGLFGAFNKKDYMTGLKDLIMELYDCPNYSDKDTQTGLTIVRDAALSILGVTTPAGLATGISGADWDNGLMPRFLVLTPEPDYRERPSAPAYLPAPEGLVTG